MEGDFTRAIGSDETELLLHDARPRFRGAFALNSGLVRGHRRRAYASTPLAPPEFQTETLPTGAGRGRREPPCNTMRRSEEHTSELQSLMRNSYAVFCLNNKKKH